MVIKIDNRFKLNPASGTSFDLVKTVVREKKDTEVKYNAEIVLGYDMRLEKCMAFVIAERLKEKEKVVDLQKFLKAYKKEQNKVLGLLDLQEAKPKRTRTRTK